MAGASGPIGGPHYGTLPEKPACGSNVSVMSASMY